MIPPKGFKDPLHPLRHRFGYGFGLSAVTTTINSGMMILIKNYKGANLADTIKVNPKNAGFELETGAICNEQSIIDKLRISMRFNYTEAAKTSGINALHVMWRPIFVSFPEKLDSVDDKSTDTGAAVLSLVKDATEEDVTPLFNNVKFGVVGTSDTLQPVSTANLTETFGILNMDTDLTMEGVSWDEKRFQNSLKYYTNKGAIKACVGKTRHMTLTENRPTKNYYIDKFVPRAVRRIMPYSFMGILVHCPVVTDDDQFYVSGAVTASVVDVGIKAIISYHEWHMDHIQEQEVT